MNSSSDIAKQTARATAEVIYDCIHSQRFETWHSGKFEDHVTCERPISKEEILQDIISLFRLDVR